MKCSVRSLQMMFTQRKSSNAAQKGLEPSRFEDLPTELKLQILGHLDFIDLTNARALNSHFKHLIELRENRIFFDPECLLCSPGNRIARFVSHNIRYDTIEEHNLDVLDALSRFLLYRGMWPEETYLSEDVRDFCDHWISLFEDDKFQLQEVIAFRTFVRGLVKLHGKHHLTHQVERSRNTELTSIFTDAKECIKQVMGALTPFDRMWWDWSWICWKIKHTPGGMFPCQSHCSDDEKLLRPLTPVTHLHSQDPELQARGQGVCTMGALCDRFSIPRLPKRIFAYYVRSEWAYGKVKDLFEKDLLGDGKNELTSTVKLKVMQEMFIC